MKHILLNSTALVALALSAPTYAQQAAETNALVMEEIVITARKKPESIQSAPLAVTAISRVQMEDQGITSFDQILATIPNASQSGGIAGGLQGLISIRGISTLVRFVGLETGVGFYVDGVYTGRPENFNQDL
ncbi:MAG: Plug domain-containing protein, partial [Kordiimonadaceae bacterium]|nr:Plug domain-containing protein [Kordiimonadaceae bacterium]